MNTEFLNLLKPPEEGDQGRKKKNRGDEPILIIIHIYMDISKGNFLCSYLKQTKMSLFSFIKSENRRVEQVLPGEVGTSGKREEVRKG
jgi:hypothetical protein